MPFDYPEIEKPGYGIAEAGNHWFIIYLNYHKEKFGKKMSFYDKYLFITKNGGINFGIIRLQTNNTLNISIEAFMK